MMRRYTLSFLTRFKSKKRICENKILSRIMSGCEKIKGLPVFLRLEEHKYTCYSSNGADGNRCSNGVESFVQSEPNKTGENQNGNECKLDRHRGYPYCMILQFILRPVPKIHLLFRHCYDSLGGAWNNLVVFSQILGFRKRAGIMLLLNLNGRLVPIGRFCTFHKLFLCRFQRSASLGPCSRHLSFDGICGISQWGFYPKRRNTIYRLGIRLAGFSCRIV